MRNFGDLSPIGHLILIWRRRWYLLLTALVVSAAGVAYAWKVPLRYKSVTRIMIESSIVSQEYVRSAVDDIRNRLIPIMNLVQSRVFIERLIEEFQLDGYGRDPRFSMDAAVKRVGAAIQVNSATENTFTMSFVWTTRELARAVTRRTAEALIQSTNATRQEKAIEADQFLDEQMRQAEHSLEAHEEKIKQFKNAHLGGLPEQSQTNLNAVSQLQAQLTAVENAIQNARDQRRMLEIRLQEQKQIRTLSRSSSRVENLLRPAVREEPHDRLQQQLEAKKTQLTETEAKYTAQHPDVVRLKQEIADLEQTIAKTKDNVAKDQITKGTADRDKEASQDQSGNLDPIFAMSDAQIQAEIESRDHEVQRHIKEKDEIDQQIRVYQSRLNLVPTLEQELLSLNREHEFLKQQYLTLQNKKFNTGMSANLEANQKNELYKVIDEANLPDSPEKPNRSLIALMGLAAGLAMGLGAVYVREYFDPNFNSADEVQSVLDLPVEIQIPEVTLKSIQSKRSRKLA
jgi:polysaccharide chain length determinant protein (PEP-CTERM system associated)